ncbi:MAG: DUF2950 domain-containing protein [Nitrospirae bacterium]|nr:DUF2950 domain-containing protein [Nitrospirota bacterium]
MNLTALHKKGGKGSLTMPACVAAIALLLLGAYSASLAAGPTQKGFPSPEEAVSSFVAAVRANDMKEMQIILGPGSEALISSGDDVADRAGREEFLIAYDQLNRLEHVSEDKMVLHIGSDDWPMPIPLVKRHTAWLFDVNEGKEEILNRRIGRNELHVIEVLDAYVDAQHEYASKNCGGSGKVEFAQKFISAEEKHDGLYWETKEGEEESPLGPLIAQAAREGYGKDSNLSPFHGYYFNILTGQGKHAEGGSYNYVVKGKMILGFALVAWPAEYANSGVMTFMVNQEGTIYQKDLGKDTKRKAEAMKVFDPDKTWQRVNETLQQQDK